ncbi:SulA-like leucine-rich domain-containing protein [Parendozoicomonas sp. Alg238-R29]|uniref:SulA-like leucine-rich domain-containing protein n=1 Tax=Parendozoicomonas sp. Alg238-R29 TaxID=2993446 RepID=UPI00248E3721|nr:SulA-like leucine-rich domain-containing protein [Parendozoicomonas sp. Alg238-R29]
MQTQNTLFENCSDTKAQPSTITMEERISEVILPSLGFSMAALVAPMLTQLSRSDDHRWLTLVCANLQAKDIAQWLKTTGVVINNLLLLTAENNEGCLNLSNKVLAAGNSHTVINWTHGIDQKAMAQLEQSASAGDCAGIIIRQRKG